MIVIFESLCENESKITSLKKESPNLLSNGECGIASVSGDHTISVE